MTPGQLPRERINQLLRVVERFYGIKPLADNRDKFLALRCAAGTQSDSQQATRCERPAAAHLCLLAGTLLLNIV